MNNNCKHNNNCNKDNADKVRRYLWKVIFLFGAVFAIIFTIYCIHIFCSYDIQYTSLEEDWVMNILLDRFFDHWITNIFFVFCFFYPVGWWLLCCFSVILFASGLPDKYIDIIGLPVALATLFWPVAYFIIMKSWPGVLVFIVLIPVIIYWLSINSMFFDYLIEMIRTRTEKTNKS